MDPGRENEFQRPVSQAEAFAVGHGLETVFRDQQQVHQHGLALLVGHHHGLGINRQHLGDGSGMILLGMVG